MGIFHTLYREARLILGFKAPPETASQMSERIAGEVKGDIGGKKSQHGDDWFLESNHQGRETKILFQGESRRVVIQIASSLENGPPFVLVAGASERETPDGEQRKPVTNGLFAQGKARDVAQMLELWKALPTGTRGNLTSLMGKHKGELRFEDGLIRLDSELNVLEGPSAKYNVTSTLTTLRNIATEMETAWSEL